MGSLEIAFHNCHHGILLHTQIPLKTAAVLTKLFHLSNFFIELLQLLSKDSEFRFLPFLHTRPHRPERKFVGQIPYLKTQISKPGIRARALYTSVMAFSIC